MRTPEELMSELLEHEDLETAVTVYREAHANAQQFDEVKSDQTKSSAPRAGTSSSASSMIRSARLARPAGSQRVRWPYRQRPRGR